MKTSDWLVVFDRRGIEFLPPFQLALQAEKLINTIVVAGAASWKAVSRLPLGMRVSKCTGLAGARGRRTLYTPLMLPEQSRLARVAPPLNRFMLRRELASIIGRTGSRAILYDSCFQLPLVGSLGESVTAYYLYDDFGVDLTGRPHGGLDRTTEARMLAAVDVVFAVSQKLCDYAARHAKQVHYLPNGYNADLFFPRPPFAARQNPVVGYSGVISGRVDLVGLFATAQERPDWSFRLIGKVEPTIERELEQTGRPKDLFQQFLALPNVELLPPRPIAGVPDVLAEFDVALVPYCLNDFTLASSPLKVYEYYAMGLPVVSTRIPEVMRFDDQIAVAEEGRSYADSISRALEVGRDAGFRSRQTSIAAPHSTLIRARDAISRLLPAATA